MLLHSVSELYSFLQHFTKRFYRLGPPCSGDNETARVVSPPSAHRLVFSGAFRGRIPESGSVSSRGRGEGDRCKYFQSDSGAPWRVSISGRGEQRAHFKWVFKVGCIFCQVVAVLISLLMRLGNRGCWLAVLQYDE